MSCWMVCYQQWVRRTTAPQSGSSQQQSPILRTETVGPSGSKVKMVSSPIRSHNAWDRLSLLRRHQTGLSVCDSLTVTHLVTE